MTRHWISNFISICSELKDKLESKNESYYEACRQAELNNGWFQQREVDRMISSISEQYLSEHNLIAWLSPYQTIKSANPKNIALISAGNIPLVAFHDLLCILAAGHYLQIKLSEKDTVLYQWLFNLLSEIDPQISTRIQIVERLQNFDAVIATGGEKSSGMFNKYFGEYPNIIRGHRNAVAVLIGDENPQELQMLGEDIFAYYGLGCRNVSKIFIPRSYSLNALIYSCDVHYSYVNELSKYQNNYDYQLAILLLSKTTFLQGNTLLFLPHASIHSPLATMHFEFYDELSSLESQLQSNANKIQTVVSKHHFSSLNCCDLGDSQKPTLHNYADQVDTLAFLTNL